MARQRRGQLREDTADSSVKLESIEVDKLQFDTSKPRMVARLGPGATQQQVQNLLVEEENARDLVPSFMANGYLPYEPLIVRAQAHGKYVVLEGNRRLAALRLMKNSTDDEEKRAFEDKHLDRIPSLVFHGDEAVELSYLRLRHLSKTKDWSAPAKAAFVERLLRTGIPLSEAAKRTNTSSQALRQLLLTRRLFEVSVELGFDSPEFGVERDLLFWHLGDAVRRRRTKQYLNLVENENPLEAPEVDDSKLEKLLMWIYGNPKTNRAKLITSIRDIPSLDQCLGNPKSAEALEAGASIQDALEAGEASGARVNAHLDRAKKSVQRATGGLTDVDSVDALTPISTAREGLNAAVEAFDREMTQAKSRLEASQ
jgi:hypothetical protein